MSISVSFLSCAIWNHVTHFYTDAETLLCIQLSLSICRRLVPGTLTDTKTLNAQAPYRKWPRTENAVSPLILAVRIKGYEGLTEQQDMLLALVAAPR